MTHKIIHSNVDVNASILSNKNHPVNKLEKKKNDYSFIVCKK